MKSAPLFLAILFSATTLWSPSHPVRDMYIVWSQHRIQRKIKELCRELYMDADMKLKAVLPYRDQYYKSLPFQLGNIVYKVQDHFKQLVINYQRIHRNISYLHYDHNQNVATFIHLRNLAMDLEMHVDMAREWQLRRTTGKEHHEIMQDPLRSGAGRDFEESEELLLEAVARGRMTQRELAQQRQRAAGPGARPSRARARTGRPPPPRAPKRKNNKWHYVRGYEFV